jgi:hypothetical protein
MVVKSEIEKNDSIRWKGTVTLSRQNADTGEVLETRKVHNTVTNYALGAIANLLALNAINQVFYAPDYIELGTGSGTAAVTDKDLITPAASTWKQCSYVTPYLSTYAQYSATWQTSDNPAGTWTEAGLFDINKNLWAHVMLGNFTVNNGEILTVQWQIQIMGD